MRILIPILLCLLCFTFNTHAQLPVKDSLHIYNERLNNLYGRVWDSLKLNDSAKFYRKQIRLAHERSKEYTAIVFFWGAEAANYSTFNTAIAKDGFGPMRGPVWQIGFGISHQAYSGFIIDFNYFVVGLGTSNQNGDATITTSSTDYLQVQLGYALINSRNFTVYPYVGLSGRSSSLQYAATDSLNSNYNSVASLIHNSRNVNVNSVHVGGQAGVGFDWVMAYHEKTHGGAILFGKFGTSGIIGHETYSISSLAYDPGIKYGAWVATVGVKLFNR
jgi:hypothetical protein